MSYGDMVLILAIVAWMLIAWTWVAINRRR